MHLVMLRERKLMEVSRCIENEEFFVFEVLIEESVKILTSEKKFYNRTVEGGSLVESYRSGVGLALAVTCASKKTRVAASDVSCEELSAPEIVGCGF
ncbi:hypothetical protein Tco_1210118 [Tanacetum coccineum]